MFPYLLIALCSFGLLLLFAGTLTWLTIRGRSYHDPAEYSRRLATQNRIMIVFVIFVLAVLAVIEWRSERFHDGLYSWQERWSERFSNGADAPPWGVAEVGEGTWYGHMSLGLYGSIAAGALAGIFAGCSLLCAGNIRTPGFALHPGRIL